MMEDARMQTTHAFPVSSYRPEGTIQSDNVPHAIHLPPVRQKYPGNSKSIFPEINLY